MTDARCIPKWATRGAMSRQEVRLLLAKLLVDGVVTVAGPRGEAA